MSEIESRTERFDESFKVLLVIASVIFAAITTYFRETTTASIRFFTDPAILFVITVLVWTFANIGDGEPEYFLKSIAWYGLMFFFGLAFVKLVINEYWLDPFYPSFISLLVLMLTLPMFYYLREAIYEEAFKWLKRMPVGLVLICVIIDVLRYVGLITLPWKP